MKLHDHKFIYGGVKYKDGQTSMAGTGAREREYFDWFFCEFCLENKFTRLNYESDTYAKVEFNATPAAGMR